MKILLTLNKTLTNGTTTWKDYGYWNVFLPLKDLGHDVYLYDTVNPKDKDYSKIVDIFKPDLIFCCMTNNPVMTPYEPWEQIEKYTKSGLVKTFNWFCDDTWRFNNFSSRACHLFTACSTPEPSYLERYKNEASYENIFLGLWHANKNLYPQEKLPKQTDIIFCGHLNQDRANYINMIRAAGLNIEVTHGLEYTDMLSKTSQSRVGINFSKNSNDHERKTQMKARMFEVPASRALLVTENTKGLENYFKIDKEIITFSQRNEMISKLKYLLKTPTLVEKLSAAGYQRYLKDHQSHIRLSNLLKDIDSI
jgi:spore maturation protein CgeB